MPERIRGRDPNRQKDEKREPPLPTYVKVAKYPDETTSQRPYTQTRDLIHATPCSLSVYRLLRGEDIAWHVAVIGDAPDDQHLISGIQRILASGETAELSPEEILLLYHRRKSITRETPGTWVERSHRPRRRTK